MKLIFRNYLGVLGENSNFGEMLDKRIFFIIIVLFDFRLS